MKLPNGAISGGLANSSSSKPRTLRKRNCLKVAFLNIASLCKHRPGLSVLLNENSIDAIGLCETSLDIKLQILMYRL